MAGLLALLLTIFEEFGFTTAVGGLTADIANPLEAAAVLGAGSGDLGKERIPQVGWYNKAPATKVTPAAATGKKMPKAESLTRFHRLPEASKNTIVIL